MDALDKAQTDMDTARAKNKELQEAGQKFMETYQLIPNDPSVWHPHLKDFVEKGAFRPLQEDNWADFGPPSELHQPYVDAMVAVQKGQVPVQGRLLEDMPTLQATMATSTSSGVDELEGDAKKLAMILWAYKRHKGELRMFGGKWVKDEMAEIPSWAEAVKTSGAQLMAVERRTHPSDHDGDYIAPVFYLDDNIQTAMGNTRPYLHEIKGIYWAEGKSGTWRRESRTWSLPALVNVFGHRFSFRWIYALWNTLDTRSRKLHSQQGPPGQALGGQEGGKGIHRQARPPSPYDQTGMAPDLPIDT